MIKQYQRVYNVSQWIRQHFTFIGHSLLILLLAAAAFGIDTRASTSYQLFSILLVVFAFALFNSLFLKLPVRAKRKLPQYFTVGEVSEYSISLTNRNKNKLTGTALIEQLQEHAATKEELEQFYLLNSKPWYARMITYRYWRRYVQFKRGGFIPEISIPVIDADDSLTIKQSFIPIRRGTLTFNGFYIARNDILGIFRRLFFITQQQRCLVLPRRYPMAAINLPGKRKYQSGGMALASSVGDSVEFTSLREYRKGDPLNTIHWKSFARHGRLIVKEYQDEYFVRRALVLDTFADNTTNDIFEGAVSVAASICMTERNNDALLDLMFAGNETYCFTTGRGIDHMPHIQEILASVSKSRHNSFQDFHKAIEHHIPQCSSIICVLLQWDEARQKLLKMLTLSGIPVMVFLIHDGTLLREQLDNKPQNLFLINYHTIAEDLSAL